jgi:hypothetical protein
MRALRVPMPLLALALAGCTLASAPSPPSATTVSQSREQNGRFIALLGPRRQHAPPFLGVPNTNFFALRSWVDTRTGQRLTQLYVEDSYLGPERNWQAAHDAQGEALHFVPISKNEIACNNGCSYAEEFAADLPEALLQAHQAGLSVVFTAKSGAQTTIAVPGELIAKQLAAIAAVRPTDQVRGLKAHSLPAAAAPPHS